MLCCQAGTIVCLFGSLHVGIQHVLVSSYRELHLLYNSLGLLVPFSLKASFGAHRKQDC